MEKVDAFIKLEKLYHENKLSHVYLIETNNIDACFKDLIKLIKKINCSNIYKEDCSDCNLCNLIDKYILPSLIIVEPDGKNIKKEQILDLKRKFSTTSTLTKENIYIIKNAEKLNNSSANTMLKFVEEPTDNIIGFFITSNINNVIPTIKSRCEELIINYLNETNDIDSEYYEIVKDYIYQTEVKNEQKILINKDLLLAKYSERLDIENIFKNMLKVYLNTLEDKNYSENNDFDFLKEIEKKDILKRIELITNVLNDINFNSNLELLVDKYIIELGDLIEKNI